MAPPMVTLAKKEPLKLVFDELPLDKEDGTESPAVITVDAEQRARRFRQQKKQQKCRLIVGLITLVIIIAVAAALTFTLVKLLRKHRQSFTIPEKSGQTTNVVVDDDNKLIHAKHHHQTGDGETVYIEILHEYYRQLIAYKDVNNSVCYIDRLTETFEVGYARWEAYENSCRESKTLKAIGKPIEIEVLKHIGDIHIFAHCQNGTSYWAMEIEEKEVTTGMRVIFV